MSRYSSSDNDHDLMSSQNDRVMDDRSMNMTRYRKTLDVDRIMLERQMTMDGTTERYGEHRRDDFDPNGNGTLRNEDRRADGRRQRTGRVGRARRSERPGRRNRHNSRASRDSRATRNAPEDDYDGSIEYGEITGTQMTQDSERYDHGMPVRSSFQSRKSNHDENAHMDFDLYDRDKQQSSSDDRLYYEDNADGMYSNLSEAMNPITEGTDPYETCITGVNTSNCWLNDNMASVMAESYGVSGYALFGIMGVMYLLSSDDIMADLVSYFEYQDKRKLNAGLITIRTKLNKYRDQFIIDNYLVSAHDYELERSTAQNLKKLAFCVVANPAESRAEVHRLNDMVQKISKVPKVFSSNTVSKIDSISLVSVCRIRPIFLYAINNVIDGRFNPSGPSRRPLPASFMRFIGVTCKFFEDREMRLIEMPLKGEEHAFGMIMSKDSDDYGIRDNESTKRNGSIADIKKLSTCINYLENRVMDEVHIPIVKTRFKTRLNKTLQNTGLRHIFTDDNYYRLYPDGAHVTDCIQYTDLIIDKYSSGVKSRNRGYSTGSKFIANSTFEYYVRDVTTNTILMIGRFDG